MFIYMSVGKLERDAVAFDPSSDILLNPRNGNPNKMAKLRGECKKDDDGNYLPGEDPVRFKRMMEKNGHVVILAEKNVGAIIDLYPSA